MDNEQKGRTGRGAEWFRNHPRLGGFIFLAGCWGLAFWGYSSIISDAEAGKAYIAIPVAFAGLVSFGVLGLSCLVGGRRAAEMLQQSGKGRRDFRFYSLVVLFVVPGLLAYLWLSHQLAKLGYR